MSNIMDNISNIVNAKKRPIPKPENFTITGTCGDCGATIQAIIDNLDVVINTLGESGYHWPEKGCPNPHCPGRCPES